MVIVYLCSFYTMLVLACFVWDTVKIPWSMFRNKPVKFSTAEYLMDRRDWKEALIFTVIFAIGIAGILPSLFGPGEDYYTAEEVDQAYEDGYNYARRDFIDCPYCGEEFPDRLAFETYDGDTICPDCIRDDFAYLIEQLENQ